MPGHATARCNPVLKFPRLRRFARDERGTTAIEFAIVAIPFLMFIFCLIGCCLYFFVVSSIEKGTDEASRLIRTGQAKAANMTVLDFKNKICDGAGRQWVQCDKLEVWTQPFTDWSDIGSGGDANVSNNGIHRCVGENNTILNNDTNYSKLIATQAGDPNDVVIVTVCYPWDFASQIPFFHFDTMQNGSMMMQSSTAFRSEPYAGPGS